MADALRGEAAGERAGLLVGRTMGNVGADGLAGAAAAAAATAAFCRYLFAIASELWYGRACGAAAGLGAALTCSDPPSGLYEKLAESSSESAMGREVAAGARGEGTRVSHHAHDRALGSTMRTCQRQLDVSLLARR